MSVNVASDEILLALAPERLVALSVLADDSQVSNAVVEAGAVRARVKTDAEQILMLRPDLVVLGANSLRIADQLESLNVRVVTIQGFESFAWIENLIRTLGDAVDSRGLAETLISNMQRRLKAVSERVAGRPRPRVLTYSPWGGTAGRGTLFDDVIRAAGGENVASQLGLSGFKRISLERLVMADPDVILYTAWRRWAPAFQDEFLSHPALHELRAFRERRVYEVPSRLMVAASHHIAETVEALAAQFHPEVMQRVAR